MNVLAIVAFRPIIIGCSLEYMKFDMGKKWIQSDKLDDLALI